MISTRVLIAVFALLAVLIVILATPFGIGITPDSTVYLEAARNLVDGHGLMALAKGEVRPLTHYPPLYPSLLALLSATHVSGETAARWLQAALFGANVWIVGLAIARYARESFWLPIIGALLTLTAPDLASVHTFALTEPLFILLTVSCLVTLARFLETERWWYLIVAALLAALAVLTRYVGGAVISTGVIALLLAGKPDWRKRFTSAIAFGAIASIPMLVWMLRNARLSGAATDRQLDFHLPGLKQVVLVFSTFSSWLLLGKVRTDLRAAFFVAEVIVASIFILYLWKQVRQSSSTRVRSGGTPSPHYGLAKLPLVILIFVVCYVGFLVITATLFDVVIFDDRAMVPVHAVSIILFLCVVWKFWPHFDGRRVIRMALVLVAVNLLGSYSLRAVNWFNRTRQDGQIYASRIWKDSQTIAYLRNLPPEVFIYSNGYDGIYYLTGRPGQFIPEKTVFVTGRANQNYEAELEKMRKTLREKKSVLVYFNTLPERWYQPAESELRIRLSLTAISTAKDGSIYLGNINPR
ncbi:MAG: glycosyltransferase family 39 protein [Pyrinomonadaceae bacterium]